SFRRSRLDKELPCATIAGGFDSQPSPGSRHGGEAGPSACSFHPDQAAGRHCVRLASIGVGVCFQFAGSAERPFAPRRSAGRSDLSLTASRGRLGCWAAGRGNSETMMNKHLLIVLGAAAIVSLALGMLLPLSWPLALRRLRNDKGQRDRARIEA